MTAGNCLQASNHVCHSRFSLLALAHPPSWDQLEPKTFRCRHLKPQATSQPLCVMCRPAFRMQQQPVRMPRGRTERDDKYMWGHVDVVCGGQPNSPSCCGVGLFSPSHHVAIACTVSKEPTQHLLLLRYLAYTTSRLSTFILF